MNYLELIIYIDVFEYVLLGIIAYWWGWHLPRQPYALIYRLQNQILSLVQKHILKSSTETFEWSKNSYTVNWDKTAYLSSHNKPVLLYVEGDSMPFTFKNPDLEVKNRDSRLLNVVLAKHTIKELAEASKPSTNLNTMFAIVLVIAGFAVGLIVGAIIAPYIFPRSVEQTTAPASLILRSVLT